MKNKKTPSIIKLSIFTLITSIFWIFFSVYRIFTEEAPPKVSREILFPLSPKLDEKTILEIENRIFIEQNQIPDNFVSTQTIETESPSPSPEIETTETEETETEATE